MYSTGGSVGTFIGLHAANPVHLGQPHQKDKWPTFAKGTIVRPDKWLPLNRHLDVVLTVWVYTLPPTYSLGTFCLVSRMLVLKDAETT